MRTIRAIGVNMIKCIARCALHRAAVCVVYADLGMGAYIDARFLKDDISQPRTGTVAELHPECDVDVQKPFVLPC